VGSLKIMGQCSKKSITQLNRVSIRVNLGLRLGLVLVLGLVVGSVPLPERPEQFLVTPVCDILNFLRISMSRTILLRTATATTLILHVQP